MNKSNNSLSMLLYTCVLLAVSFFCGYRFGETRQFNDDVVVIKQQQEVIKIANDILANTIILTNNSDYSIDDYLSSSNKLYNTLVDYVNEKKIPTDTISKNNN